MDPDVRAQRPPRWAWTIIAWAGGAVFVLLCAVFAVPMVIDFRQEAPQANPPTVAEGLAVTPERGATQQQVTVSGEGFRPGEDVTIVAGLDPGDMRVLAHDQADDQGRLTADLTIPEWAERGKPFYFAAEQDGNRAGMASVNVVVPNEPGAINALPPGGEVKTPPLP